MSAATWGRVRELAALAIVIAVMAALFRWYAPAFGRLSFLGQMISQRPDLIALAVAMTFVLLVGEIDLSVGAVLALASVAFGVSYEATGSGGLGVAAGLLTGALCGLANGLITVGLRIPSFVVTLGMMQIARGLAYWLSNMRRIDAGGRLEFLIDPIPGLASLPVVGTLSLTNAVLIAAAVAVAGHITLRRTVFGRHAQAIGDNLRAAELSGVRVGRVKVAVFVLAGLAAGAAGLMQTARFDTTDQGGGVAFELVVIAAVVVGGTSLTGGRASVVGTLLGCLLIAVLEDGLSLLGTGEVAKRLSTGGVILLAVLLDAWRRRT